MEDSDDRKRKKPETFLEDGLRSLNPPKIIKSQDEDAVAKLDGRDSDGGGTKADFDSKGEENGSVEKEIKQVERSDPHSGGEGQGAKKIEALDTEGIGSSANGKEKEMVKDKGKGKILVESETEDDDDEEDGGVGGVDEDTDSDLSDDPLMEVDPANILPSWTRRRTAHSGPYPMSTVAGVDDDDDDDDISGGEDEVDDDNDGDDDEDEDDD